MAVDRELDKWDYIYYAIWVGAALGFLMWGLGLLGEYLGWWNDVGEALMLVGRWAGFGLTAVAVLIGASRSQVERTKTTVEETKAAVQETKVAVHETRDAVHETKDAVHETRDAVHETKDAVHETKDAVHQTKAAVETNGSKLDDQTRVLREIRDRL